MRTYVYNQKYQPHTYKRLIPSGVLLCIAIVVAVFQYVPIFSSPNTSAYRQSTTTTEPARPKSKPVASDPVITDKNSPKDIAPAQVTQPSSDNKITSSTLSWLGPINATDLLIATNTIRAENGITKLQPHTLLSASATAKCNDMAERNYWSHIDPDGREPWYFIDKTGYKKLAAGENLAFGFKNSKAIIDGWMNSPEHKAAILNATYQDIGFGICSSKDYQNVGQQIIIVQHFGAQ
jgi:uncharacterized protein YkwD